MNKDENLYFIAIIPQHKLCDEINSFKNDFATRFNSKKALKLPPHITLKAPFKLTTNAHDSLLQWFANLRCIVADISFPIFPCSDWCS